MPTAYFDGKKLVDTGSALTIEEYDTKIGSCNWHVRKWSNGYCEFIGWTDTIKTRSEPSKLGENYMAGTIDKYQFPFKLLKKYP